MKCLAHHAEAVAVCAYCGRALCCDCIPNPAAPRLACSVACTEALNRTDAVVQQLSTINQQLRRSAQASAFYCYLCAGLSAAAAFVAWFMLPSPFLILFTAGCALVLTLSGAWYGRSARRQSLTESKPPRSTSPQLGNVSPLAAEPSTGDAPKLRLSAEV